MLTEILQNNSQETSGEYNECGAVAPMPLYTIFQTVMSDICPWTVSFTHLKSTENTMKVTLSTPNIAKGVEITKWKELTFFLPSELRRISAKDFRPFTLKFLGNRVDYGDVPHSIFHPNIFKSALGGMLEIIEHLPVCPGINDPALIETAERKNKSQSYFVDTTGTVVNGQVVKCIRSTGCAYKLSLHSKIRCSNCQDVLRAYLRWQTTPSSSTFESKTAHDSRTKLSTLSRAELVARAKNLHKMVAQGQRKAKKYYSLYQKEKQKNIKAPQNYNPKSSDLAKLMDIAIENQWLAENSVLYALLIDTLTSLKKQEAEFAKHGNLTENKQKPHPKGMRYNPLVFKRSCMIASKCHKKGYEIVRSILPIPNWETVKQYRQAASTTNPISQENLTLMIQEMTRRGCKGIGGIHWDEIAIKEGIVLCKRTGELVGFEDLNIDDDLNTRPEDLNDNDEEHNDISSESADSDSLSVASDQEYDSSPETVLPSIKQTPSSKKAKLVCQFLFSSLEGDFSCPVASLPLHKINHKILCTLVWQVCEAIGGLKFDDGKKIEVLYGVSDGSTCSHAFFSRVGAQNWVTYNPFNDNKPI